MPRTTFGKTRPQDNPYATYTNAQGWTWKVLKTYPHSSSEDDYSRWFVAATSPMMHGGAYELGDTYAHEIKNYGTLIQGDPLWIEQYHKAFDLDAHNKNQA
jgi:hypothetical protein